MLASLALAGIIISPFFWLRFLKEKSVGKYLVVSSVVTLVIFIAANTLLYKFILQFINSYDALFYFDGISMGGIYMTILLIVLSPFIFTKILKNTINTKNFFISLLYSCLIFISIFLFWVYVLLPKAFGDLLKHL
jgi:hypothetical protein